MLVFDIFRLSTRMFRTNFSRTMLTILGIGVGIGAILFLVSFGYGLQRLILNQITTSDALLSLDVTTGDITNIKLDTEAINDMNAMGNVDKISPVVSTQAQMVVGDISSELEANFADREFFKLDGTTLMDGDFYSDNQEDKNKIIISSTALQLFSLEGEDIFNKIIKFSFLKPEGSGEDESETRDFIKLDQEFKVVGVIEEESSSYVYLPFSISRDLGFDNYSKIKVRVDEEKNLDVIRNSIVDKGFMVSALSDIIEQANQIFKVVQIVLASFGIVALIVSAIGMFNTMTIALLERTQEIGIMKALGATSADIWQMFLAEAFIIGFLGGTGGIVIGLSGGELFNYLINVLAGAMGGMKIDMFYTPFWFILLIIVFSTVVGLMTGFYPARRAAKINALEALRYK